MEMTQPWSQATTESESKINLQIESRQKSEPSRQKIKYSHKAMEVVKW